MSDLYVLLLGLLATWRLARLVAVDELTVRFRAWVAAFDPKTSTERRPMLGYLVSCPWCISMWIAPFTMSAAVLWPDNRVVVIVLAALSASGIAGFLTTVEDRLDR